MKVKDILRDGSQWIPGEAYDQEAPMVSVLLPTFRRAASGFFRRAVESVLDQTFRDLELIIIDDASTDGTAEQIQALMAKDARVSCIRHTWNVGLPAISEYEGYMRARGQYIAFIFDDNEWESNALEDTLPLMQKENAKACCGVARLYHPDDDEYDEIGTKKHGDLSVLFYSNCMPNGAMVLDREVFEAVGLYDPHLALTRLCDWDLWRRVVKSYPILYSGIFFTSEYGWTLSDSLGNSSRLNIWISEECMQVDRTEKLLPKNFGEYDILDLFGGRSATFVAALQAFLEPYRTKEWYDENENSLRRLFTTEAINSSIRYILLWFSAQTASVDLVFMRTFLGGEHVYRSTPPHGSHLEALILADMAILCRDLPGSEYALSVAKRLNVPVYYYVDDNFIALHKDFPEDEFLKVHAYCTCKEMLTPFSGLLVPSPTLQTFFADEKMNDNVLLLPPSIDEKRIRPLSPPVTDCLRVCFMGGNFRKQVLLDMIIPALRDISQRVRVKLYCPRDVLEVAKDTPIGKKKRRTEDSTALIPVPQDDRFSITLIPRHLLLDTTLALYGSHQIHIQVHCSETLLNNSYKTQNALINATQMGAVLVATASPSYPPQVENPCYEAVENTLDSWHMAMEKIAFDNTFREALYQNARTLCITAYHPDRTVKAMLPSLYELPEKTIYSVYERGKNYYTPLDSSGSLLMRPIESLVLVYRRNLPDTVQYGAVFSKRRISGIGMIFSSEPNNCRGTIFFDLLQNGKELRKAQLRMENIVNNQWSFFRFDTLNHSGKEPFVIRLTFEYDSNNRSVLGLYEDTRNRTFFYRVRNKLGLKPLGKNVIYVNPL